MLAAPPASRVGTFNQSPDNRPSRSIRRSAPLKTGTELGVFATGQALLEDSQDAGCSTNQSMAALVRFV